MFGLFKKSIFLEIWGNYKKMPNYYDEKEKWIARLDAFAKFYDEVWPFTDDLEFWIKMVKKWVPFKTQQEIEILELGSGTGRVTLYLAERGYKVTGLEISEKMIGVYEEKKKNYPKEVQERVKVLKNDIRYFDLKGHSGSTRKFDIIICPFNTFPNFGTLLLLLKTSAG